MPEQLLQFDRHLFYFINHNLANPFFDWLMPLLRTPTLWIPLYVFIIIFCLWRYKRTGAVLIISLALSVGFADYTSAHIIKHLVKRERPCRDVLTSKTNISRVPCGTGYSFPSTHATDHFAIAVFLSGIFYKRYTWLMPTAIVWAAAICFAQVYVGVHYPFDVTGGAIYGALVGWLFIIIFKRSQPGFAA